MKITNKYGLPQTLVRLVENDGYSRGKAKMSVTSLIMPPRIVQLRKRFDGEITIDVSDMIWVIFGRAMHTVLEQGGDETHLPEERLFAQVSGWDISGAVDLQIIGDINGEQIARIRDYKSTSVWSVIFGKPDWIAQLNCYAWLVTTVKDIRIESLGVVAFLKDWKRDGTKDRDYPQTPIIEIDIPLWSYQQQTDYIKERVRLHQEGEMAAVFDEPLPECTDEERWTRKSDWSVMYPGGERAYRCFPDTVEGENDARDLAAKMKPKKADKPYTVVRRVGDRNRCLGNYCNVSHWCDQWQSELQRKRDEMPDLDAGHQEGRA